MHQYHRQLFRILVVDMTVFPLHVIYIFLIQYFHREALGETAKHSAGPDQEACPHHDLILKDPDAIPDSCSNVSLHPK